MKKIKKVGALILIVSFFFIGCKKETLKGKSSLVANSAALVAKTEGNTGTMTVQVKVPGPILETEKIWANIAGINKIMDQIGENTYSRGLIINPADYPSGNYTARIQIQNESGKVVSQLQSNTISIDWGGGTNDTVTITVYDSVYVNNHDTVTVTVHDTVTVGETTIKVKNFHLSNIIDSSFSFNSIVETNFTNAVSGEVRISKWNNNTTLESYPFTTPVGGGNFQVQGNFSSGQENTQYKVQYFIMGENTPFYQGNITTLESGIVEFDFVTEQTVTPTGAQLHYVGSNASSHNITVDLRAWSGGIQTTTSIVIPQGAIHATGIFSASNFPQNTVVNYEAKINNSIVSSGQFSTNTIIYSNIQYLNGVGGTTAQAVNPNHDVNYQKFKFDSDGNDTIKEMSIYFESDSLQPWNYINTVHGNTYSKPASLSSHWTQIGAGIYRFHVNNISIPITQGINIVDMKLISNNYQNTGNFQFDVYISAKDRENNTIENSNQKGIVIF